MRRTDASKFAFLDLLRSADEIPIDSVLPHFHLRGLTVELPVEFTHRLLRRGREACKRTNRSTMTLGAGLKEATTMSADAASFTLREIHVLPVGD